MRRLLGLCLVLTPLLAGCATGPGLEVPSAPPGPLPLVPGPGTPRVHLQLDPPDTSLPGVELREVAGWQLEAYQNSTKASSVSGTRVAPGSRALCPIPCGAIVEGRGDHEFFFSGPGIHRSKPFELVNESGELLFKVRPGSQDRWRSGELFTVAGTGVSAVGATLFTLVMASESYTDDAKRLIPGTSLLGVGAALVGVGVTLMLTNRTTYSIQRAQVQLQAPR